MDVAVMTDAGRMATVAASDKPAADSTLIAPLVGSHKPVALAHRAAVSVLTPVSSTVAFGNLIWEGKPGGSSPPGWPWPRFALHCMLARYSQEACRVPPVGSLVSFTVWKITTKRK